MLGTAISYGLQFSGYGLEVLLLFFLLSRGLWRNRKSLALYVSLLVAMDAVGRPLVLYHFGVTSQEYAYFFWISDVVLTLAAFVLVCALFRRACESQESMWHQTRLLLALVFVLVLGISFFSLSRNFQNLFSNFIIEFQQNLYFTCLILITLLYVLMQKVETVDDELTLLVCGLGIQFAGPAASLALLHLAPGQGIARFLASYLGPLCTLGMLLIWFYAVAFAPKVVKEYGPARKTSEFTEAVAREG